MKNRDLLLIGLGVGAVVLLMRQRKPKRAYTIEVPPPQKITETEFRTGILQKAAPVVKKALSIFKKKPKLTAQQQQAAKALTSGRKIFGATEFPDFC